MPIEYVVHAGVAGGPRAGAALHTGGVAATRSGSTSWSPRRVARWDERAHVGDLEAVRHRSRITEAAALTDPAGLGAHRVLVFRTRT